MYFYKVPSGSSFTLSATVKVNSINAAGATNPNQISFGLMARDDIYLDKNMATAVSSDYVAAAPYDINADKSSTTCCFAKKSNTIIKGSPFTRGEEVKEGGTYDLKIESQAEEGIIETQSVLAGELLTKGMAVSVTIKTE